MDVVENLTADPWLELGITGAALFVILVVVVLMFRQQSQSIDRLCVKLDRVVSCFADNNTKLTEVLVTNDKDQKQLLQQLGTVQTDIRDIQCRVTRIDTRMDTLLSAKVHTASKKEVKENARSNIVAENVSTGESSDSGADSPGPGHPAKDEQEGQ